MFSITLALLIHGLYLSLRLGGSGGSFPRPLTPEEEKDALEKSARGDMAARNLLIEHNLRLVAHVLRKYYTSASDQEDLLSIGTIGLIKAIASYSPDKHVKLPTYACKCIQNEIFMYFRRQRRNSHVVSLSDPIESDRDGNALSLLDVISVDDMVLENLEQAESEDLLHELVETRLDDREKCIITLRYGLGSQPPMAQREVAQGLGISRSYVSRLEKKALSKLEACFYEAENSCKKSEVKGKKICPPPKRSKSNAKGETARANPRESCKAFNKHWPG